MAQMMLTTQSDFDMLRHLKVVCAYISLEERANYWYKGPKRISVAFGASPSRGIRLGMARLKTRMTERLLTFLRRSIPLTWK